MLQSRDIVRVFRHGHMACGIGAGARGFNRANPRIGNVVAHFECAGGIDVDAGAIRNFERMTGVKGTVMDLFDRDQYFAFHGHEPPPGWKEATPADIRAAFGRLDVCFASYPCKGFSGLLSNAVSRTAKYQALNALTLRGMWLTLEAYRDDPIPILLFENVPRIMTRGRWLLDQITALLRGYGYHVTEDTHDCGEIGWLAQSRRRYLLIARHPDKVPPFIYQPAKHPLRGVGEVIGKLPLPGDPAGGAMHRVPALQWRTWVRLAFVKAGHDWRSLNELAVEDGFLRDYGIIPEGDLRPNAYGVARWSDAAGLITSARAPGQGRFSVADPRPVSTREGSGFLGVNLWRGSTGVISTRGLPTNGAYSIADPRPGYGEATHRHVLGVRDWHQASGVLSCSPKPTTGAHAVADPRPGYKPGAHHNLLSVAAYAGNARTIGGAVHVAGGAASVADPRQLSGNLTYQQYGVRAWGGSATAVTAQSLPGGGPHSVADPRIQGRPRFNNVYRVVPFQQDAPAVAGPGGPGGGLAVADPRAPDGRHVNGKYRVTGYGMSANSVIGASSTGMGAFVVADPRCTWGPNSHRNKLKVVAMSGKAPTVTGSDRVGSGAMSVADPRPACLSRTERDSYLTQGHYGVVSWGGAAGAIPAFAKNNNGRWSLADPRVETAPDPAEPANDWSLPAPGERLVARIIALDGTWHRPFTTLELAALQSLFDPEEIFAFDPALDTYVRRWERSWDRRGFDLDAGSDSTRREWIGNAVPSASAQKMAEEIGEALLLASMGETFTLSSKEIWVKPLALALAVNPDQAAFHIDMGHAA